MTKTDVIDQKPKDTAIAKSPRSKPAETGLAAFKRGLESESKRRKMMTAFIKEHLKEGVDFGAPFPGSKKPTLLKPGAEKFLPLLDLVCEFTKDTDTWQMLGSNEGTVAYVCKVYTKKSHAFVGEGRGVCTVAERQDNPNTAVKIAEKRAQVDAVLRVFGLSDVFTQDAEDAQKPDGNGQPATSSQSQTQGSATKPMSASQRNFIFKLFDQREHEPGYEEEVREQIRKGMTTKEASERIDELLKMPEKPNEEGA